MRRALCLAAGFAAMLMLSTVSGFSRAQTQNRVPQQVVINGLTVNAATVMTAAGQIQSFTCSSPQHYTAADAIRPTAVMAAAPRTTDGGYTGA